MNQTHSDTFYRVSDKFRHFLQSVRQVSSRFTECPTSFVFGHDEDCLYLHTQLNRNITQSLLWKSRQKLGLLLWFSKNCPNKKSYFPISFWPGGIQTRIVCSSVGCDDHCTKPPGLAYILDGSGMQSWVHGQKRNVRSTVSHLWDSVLVGIFRYILEGLWMENIGIFYMCQFGTIYAIWYNLCHLVYFMVYFVYCILWYILWSFGIFFPLWYFVAKIIWQPCFALKLFGLCCALTLIRHI
jgi:hypothetical protein